MDRDLLVILGLLATGFAWGLLKKPKRPGASIPVKVGLGLLGVLAAGLALAITLKIEVLAWVFGLSLMVAIPLLILLAIGTAIGRLVRKQDKDPAA